MSDDSLHTFQYSAAMNLHVNSLKLARCLSVFKELGGRLCQTLLWRQLDVIHRNHESIFTKLTVVHKFWCIHIIIRFL